MIGERELTKGKVCARCGAAISARLPGRSCPACLIESGLEPEGLVENLRNGAAPLMMNFGDYELLEEIGRGGQGVVFRARQKSLNRIVALKVIGLGHWATEAHIRRFRQEAEAAASLEHPQIVPIYEIGERDGSCYFSMKFVEGGRLDQVATGEKFLPRRAAELIVRITRTVQFAHDRGVLHRDIKPGNVLLDRQGEPHLTDFGLARLIENESAITNSFEVLGTPSYMPPEQASGCARELTPAADIYSIGAVFYQMLTGEPPFAGGTTYETIRKVLETEPRDPRLWNAKVDVDAATICLKCLEKDPTRRYQSAAALAEDLERWLRHEPIQARRIGIFSRACKWVRRNPTRATLIPSLAAVAAFAFATFWKPSAPPTGLAVLPFENLSDDKSDASLVDGIQDDILTKLAKVAQLKVISRTSVMQYRGEHNVRKIGSALRVSHVLEGSVRKMGHRIHLNAQLIDTRTDSHVWAEQYDRDLSDVFAIQSELAQRIAGQLSSRITRAERTAIESRPTEDMEAYDLYIRAKTLGRITGTDDPNGLERSAEAADLLEKAVRRDPNFALAYSLLAELDLDLYWGLGRWDRSRRDRAEVAVNAAQRLAPAAGETHLAQAYFYHYGDGDYDHALEELDVAARSLPNNADVFELSARIERRLARWNEALRHFSKANELDPREPSHLVNVALTYRMLRRYAEAERTADEAIAAFPKDAGAFWHEKAEAALARGDIARARSVTEKISSGNAFPWVRFRILFYTRDYVEAERVSLAQWQGKDDSYVRFAAFWSALAARAQGDIDKMRSFLLAARHAYETGLSDNTDPDVFSSIGLIDAGLGRKEEALVEARKATELRPISSDALEGPLYATNLALVYAWTGERDRALEQLSTVVRVPDGPTYGELKLSPTWDDLRDHPRFEQLMTEAAKPVPLK
jgi:TolB-like protein/Flp pilus assembly protein TadD/predicted Ser/Thr protein kinase